jgi:hypothetical protein
MSEDDKKEFDAIFSNIINIDQGRIKKLAEKGHYNSLLEKFDILRIKFVHDDLTDKEEAIKFVTLCKYFIKNGHSESLRLSCHYMYEKYMKKQGL